MSERVNTKRSYDAGRRRRQAQLTRQRILDVAQRLFVERGYAAVSITDIAREADVSAQSAYASFGNKRKLLLHLLRTRVTGDESPTGIHERPWFRDMLAEPDPRRLLRLHAHYTRRIAEQAGPMAIVLRQAAGSDPELAADYQQTRRRRYQEQSVITAELARRRTLRPELGASAAADILWTLSAPETYEALVLERGWPAESYERWLADTLITALLPDPGI